MADIQTEQLLEWYQTMVQIRGFEDEIQRAFMEGLVPGTTHLAQGQEAVATGVIAALRPDDYVTMTYRGHAVAIARGIPLREGFAELFGRTTGVCRGKGGSMHLTDFSRGLIGCFAIVGAGLPVAVGAGQSAKLQGLDRVSVTFFGDGSTNIGAFHEAMNLAAVWQAPVVFVCENNLYGEYSRITDTTPYEDLARRAEAYAMPARIVDGNDVITVYEAAAEAVDRARDGHGPTFLECKTYRYSGHSRTDPGTYRPPEEVEKWRLRDPIVRLAQHLRTRGTNRGELEAIEGTVARAVKQAAAAAKNDPVPEMQDLLSDVYETEA